MSWTHAVIDVPARAGPGAAAFWAAVLGWPVGPEWPGHPELRSFEPPSGDAYVHLQTIDGSPRVHLDLDVADVAATRDRAVLLGASTGPAQQGRQGMFSPGGLPFCLVREHSRTAPEPVIMAEGHRTRLVQVCIDAPRSAHDGELVFWRSLLSGRWGVSDLPEFSGKYHDDQGAPLQWLFQRLDEESGRVRAHLDLATDNLEAERARHIALGAEVIGKGQGWVPFRDPVGLPYCITKISPDQQRHRDFG